MAGAEGPSPHLRAADDDRETAAEAVRAAAGDGRLTLDEADERLGAVYAAQTHGDLAAVTADLRSGAGRPWPGSPLGGGSATGGGNPISGGTVGGGHAPGSGGWPAGVDRLPVGAPGRTRGGTASRVPVLGSSAGEGGLLLLSAATAAGAGAAGAGPWAALPVLAGWAWSARRRR